MQTATLDSRELRRALSCFATGVAAVGGTVNGSPYGLVANSFTSVSLDPPLISVCVDKGSSTWPILRQSTGFGISVLSEGQTQLCRQMAAKGVDRFSGVDFDTHPSGAISIADAVAWFRCSIYEEIPAGDHDIVLFEVLALEADPALAPLIFHASKFRSLPPEEREF